MSVVREHWLNADFDLSLRPRWPGLDPARRRQVRQLEWHALGLAGPGDSVRLHLHPGDELLELLARAGFEAPPITLAPRVRVDAELEPFGWNHEAAELARGTLRPGTHPPLDAVRRVNARSFGAALERELGDGRWWLAKCRSVAELARALAGVRDRPGGWVVKAEHANAGLGNRRLVSRELGQADRRWAERVLGEDDRLHVEPWVRRRLDLSAVFSVGSQGEVEEVAVHEVVTTSAGAFLGALFADPTSDGSQRWVDQMAGAARRVAGALVGAGYWGPACIDGFVWDDRGHARLRVLADLNARRHISAGGRALGLKLAPEAVALWRFYPARRLRQLVALADLMAALENDAFDPRRRTGALPTSPLWVERDGRRRRTGKLAMLLLGSSREEVLAIDRRVRLRLER